MTVAGEGPLPCDWLILGWAPSHEEEAQSRPFVGPAGRKLDQLLVHAGLQRSAVRLDNVLQTKLPGNRKPTAAEIASSDCLVRVEACQPKVIVALGDVALKALGIKGKITALEGRPLQHNGYVVVPMLHPAAVLHPGGAALGPRMIASWKQLRMAVEQFGSPAPGRDYHLAKPHEIAAILRGQSVFAFDLETTSPKVGGVFQPFLARPLGFSVATAPGKAWYCASDPASVATWLTDPVTVKICHNSKFEYSVLGRQGIELRNFEDTKLLAYSLGYGDTRLKTLARDLLHESMLTYEEVTAGREPEELSPEEWLPYGAADSDMTLRLYHKLMEERP